ncbi:2-vinyl bacteriochlorophyllide hydratase [Gemmatimonadetes bacterium T265]|nr:2-vinyl bacteriochlorophyllide hydratase [Gemmatimonadetes bacterium T265]
MRMEQRTDRNGTVGASRVPAAPRSARSLYTPAERARRDRSPWTAVQGVLAAVQFLVFLVSLMLVLHALVTGRGYGAATASVVVKTLALYAIMITGAAWEKDVFGRWLFAEAFFWEDVVSMLVIALHTAYLAALAFGLLPPRALLALALAAYATYAVNATQFLVKFRRARRDAAAAPVTGTPGTGTPVAATPAGAAA